MPVDVVPRMVTDTAMASAVRIIASDGSDEVVAKAMAAALAVIKDVEATCSRFDPASALSRVNAEGAGEQQVPHALAAMVATALIGYRSTSGRFDPRILRDLEQLGYDRTFQQIGSAERPVNERSVRGPWEPVVDLDRNVVDLRDEAIDLGGVAKGAAADRALAAMAACGVHGLVDIGGDGAVSGPNDADTPWSIGVEDPNGGSEPVAVFGLATGGYATSSIRLRHWEAGGETVHHLVDPATGRSGGAGLRSVTIVAPDGATAEVECKAAFLAGLADIGRHAADRSLACLWIDDQGALSWSAAMADLLIWIRP